MLDARGEHAAGHRQAEQCQADQQHAPATERVGNGAVPQRHDGERNEVGGHRLLDFERSRAQRLPDVVE